MTTRCSVALVLALAGCGKPSRKQTCDELAKSGLAFADALSKQLGDGKSISGDPEIQAKMAELRAECMTWPDEVFECMRKNDETSPACVEAMSKVTGKRTAELDKAPAGPAIATSARLGESGWDGLPVALAGDGTITAAPKDAVVAFAATGKERWRTAVDHAGWLLALPDGAVLLGDRAAHELVALDPETGAARWRTAVPFATADDEYGERSTEGAVRGGGRTLVAIADGRFLRVDPGACAKRKQVGCVELAFALADETLDDPKLLAVDGDLVIGESSGIRRIAADGTVVASIHVRESLGGIAVVAGSRVAASFDDELVVLDLAHCTPAHVALPRKRGRMYVRGDGECEDCTPPPTGCVVGRSELSDVESTTPRVLGDGSIVVTTLDGVARATNTGAKQWVTEVDVVGASREVGDTVVFVSRAEDDAPARLVALETSTGKVKWVRALPEVKSSDISYSTDTIVETVPGWLVTGAKGNVSWIRLPPRG